jgi:alkaline phosphatase
MRTMHTGAPALLALTLLTLATATPAAPPAAVEGAQPRNIILMIADGCGFNHLRAGSLWRDDADLFTDWTDLPVSLAVSTYAEGGGYDPDQNWVEGPSARPATDSAAAITALTTGRKTINGRLAVDPAGAPILTIVQAMERGGRSTGLVTSVQFAHATPAGCVVNGEDRGRYLEISSEQLTRSGLDVLMGAGHPLFDRQGAPAQRHDYRCVGGEDTWQGLLAGTVGGDADGDGWPDPWRLVEEPAAFAALAEGPTPARVLGVARVRETLQQQRPGDRQAAPFVEPPLAGVPSLTDMARGALNVLDADPDGFFLMIEGGAVDWAAHDNQAGRLVEEVVGFAEAVAAVRRWIDANGGWERNLLLITADHETGYLTGPSPAEGPAPACPAALPLLRRGVGNLPGLEFHSRNHTNALVPLLAAGTGSERLPGLAGHRDPVRGPYLDNTAIGLLLQDLATH